MEERTLTEKESLEVITSMIARTKQRYIGDGRIMLMWGYLVTLVSIAVWIMLASTGNGIWNFLWFAIPVIGCPLSVTMAKKQQRQNGIKTFSDKVTSQLWTIAGVSQIVMTVFCLGFQYISGIDCWSAMIVFPLIVMPFAEIAQGLFIREKSLTVGGSVGLIVGIITLCCVAGKVALYVNWYMPLFIIAFVAMMIIPGHILNHKAA